MTDGQGHIGRVFGERVMEIRFRIPSSEPLQVGEMLVVEDDPRTPKLPRSHDGHRAWRGHGSSRLDGSVKQGLMLQKDSAQEKAVMETSSIRLYKIGVSTPLGYIENQAFRKTKSIPTHFSVSPDVSRRTMAS